MIKLTIVCVAMAVFDFGRAIRIVRKYSKELEVETFLMSASVEDIVMPRFFMLSAWTLMQLATIVSILKG